MVFSIAALKKKAICIGSAALSQQTALLLEEFAHKYRTFLRVIYPLRYSLPIALIKANMEKIGAVQSINVDATFQEPVEAKQRLYSDCNTVLHQVSHGLIDAVSALCDCSPVPIATTCHRRSILAEHFRLQQLQCVHIQTAFGRAVASVRIASHNAKTLIIRVVGELGFFQLDPRMLVLEGHEGQVVLWRGDGTVESIIRTGIIRALENCDSDKITGISELSLVQCVSNCRFI